MKSIGSTVNPIFEVRELTWILISFAFYAFLKKNQMQE